MLLFLEPQMSSLSVRLQLEGRMHQSFPRTWPVLTSTRLLFPKVHLQRPECISHNNQSLRTPTLSGPSPIVAKGTDGPSVTVEEETRHHSVTSRNPSSYSITVTTIITSATIIGHGVQKYRGEGSTGRGLSTLTKCLQWIN